MSVIKLEMQSGEVFEIIDVIDCQFKEGLVFFVTPKSIKVINISLIAWYEAKEDTNEQQP